MSDDVYLKRWSGVLYVVVAIALAHLLFSTAQFLAGETRISFLNGGEVWSIKTEELPPSKRGVLLAIAGPLEFMLLYAQFQLFNLAQRLRRGEVFTDGNARLIVRTGCAIATAGALGALNCAGRRYYLYWLGLYPWLGDAPITYGVKYNYVMVGLFLFILGQVLRRAVVLEENSRSII